MKASFLVIALAFSIPLAQAVTITIDNRTSKDFVLRWWVPPTRTDSGLPAGKSTKLLSENSKNFMIKFGDEFFSGWIEVPQKDTTYTLTGNEEVYYLDGQKYTKPQPPPPQPPPPQPPLPMKL